MAHIATICCASTSNGLRGTVVDSMRPSSIPSTTAAASSRSPRNFGMTTPRETSPTECPARPTRWIPAATLGGANRDVAIVDAGRLKTMEVKVEVPVEDMSQLKSYDDSGQSANSIWPAIYPRLLSLIRDHRSTIVFVNSRRL